MDASWQALKLLLDIGDTLTGRLMVYDALEQDFTTVTVKRDPECPACAGRRPSPKPKISRPPDRRSRVARS